MICGGECFPCGGGNNFLATTLQIMVGGMLEMLGATDESKHCGF